MLSILIIFTIITGCTHLLLSLWRNRRFLLAAARIPGPPGFPPLLGGVYQFYGKSDIELAASLLDISQRYSSPVKFWLGPLLMVVVDRPEDLKIVLNSPHCLDKVDPYRFFRVDQGLFAAPKKLWKMHRRILLPAFGPKVVDGFLPTFAKSSRKLCNDLERFVTAGEVDIHYGIEKCALKSICATFFQYDIDARDETWIKTYINSIDRLTSLINQRIFNPLKHPDQLYKLTSSYKEEKQQFKIFKQLPNEIQMAFIDRQQQRSPDKTSPHFIDRIFQLSPNSSDSAAIQNHLETIIFAGSETTATTLSTTLLMLAIHRDVQEKVYREISTVCPNPFDRDSIDQGTLSRLMYSEQVIKETMRLFPIGPIVARKVTGGDVRLTQVTVPAGANIAVPIFKLQRNPNYWGADAECFDPDRFSPERSAQRHPYSYIPFTAGLRNCVGIRYSWQLMKVALVHLLWRYRFSTELTMQDPQLKLSMVLRIENGSVLRIEQRF